MAPHQGVFMDVTMVIFLFRFVFLYPGDMPNGLNVGRFCRRSISSAFLRHRIVFLFL